MGFTLCTKLYFEGGATLHFADWGFRRRSAVVCGSISTLALVIVTRASQGCNVDGGSWVERHSL